MGPELSLREETQPQSIKNLSIYRVYERLQFEITEGSRSIPDSVE
jgi:hypothetical protein